MARVRPHPRVFDGSMVVDGVLFLQERERYVESHVSYAIGIKRTARIFHQNGRAAGNPVDASDAADTVSLETAAVAHVDVKCHPRLFAGCDQVVVSCFMGEYAF